MIVVLAGLVYSFFKGSYNQFVTLDEGVKLAWAQVENEHAGRDVRLPPAVAKAAPQVKF